MFYSVQYTIKVNDTIRDMSEEVIVDSLKEAMDFIMDYEEDGVFFDIYQKDTLVWTTTSSLRAV